MPSAVSVTTTGAVAQITFSAPPHNFATPGLLGQIADALDAMDADDAVRCTVLAAEGRTFCGGADLAGDESMAGNDIMSTVGQLYAQAARLFKRTKPVVAAVQGSAVGAGLGLALSADFRVAGPNARFSANFVRLAFHPGFALTCTLPRVIGQQRAHWMMLSADRVKPVDALAWGLVDAVAEDGDVLAAAHRMAAKIADNGPLALIAVRATMIGRLADDVVAAMAREFEQQSLLQNTADYKEGVASVFERREAHFIGR